MSEKIGCTTQYQLVNAYEELVANSVRELMAKQDMCHCEKCFCDVCALVLNKGYVNYVTTLKGELLAKLPILNNAKRVQLLVAVSEAIELVRSSPRH